MPDIDTIINDPGQVIFNSQTFYDNGDGIVVELITDYFDINSSIVGRVDRRPRDRRVEVRFTPVGEFEAISTLFSLGSAVIGSTPFGGNALVVHTRSGKKVTIHNAAITSVPSFAASVDKTVFGEVVFTGLIKNETDPNDAAAYYTLSDAAYPGDTNFDPTAILTRPFSAEWGASPWDEFWTEDGFEFNFTPEWQEKYVDGWGTVKMILSGIEATVTCTPVGPTVSELLARADFQGSHLGSSPAAPDDFNVAAITEDIYMTLYNAKLEQPSLNYSNTESTLGEVTWYAKRSVTSGAIDPVFYIGSTDPSAE